VLELRQTVEATTDQEKKALQHVQEALSHAAVRPEAAAFLIGPREERIALPEPLFRILRQAAAMLSHGHRVTLAPVDKELSTQEAADLLNVSRPHLVKLLNEGLIQFTKTGRNRRVMFGDVVRYMYQRNAERRERLHALIRESEKDGLYDMEEFALDETR